MNEDEQSSLMFLFEPKDISDDFSRCSPNTNTAVNKTGVSSMSTSDSSSTLFLRVTPTKTSSPSKTSAVTTPVLHSTRTIKARNLFQSYTSSSLSTVTSHATPTMSSTPFRLQPTSVNKIKPNHSSKNLLTNLQDNIICYHCGNTISIQRSLKNIHRFDMGVSAASRNDGSVLETGRTVFDLEKLADTGTVRESIFSLETSDCEKTPFLFERQDFLTTMLRSPSKTHCRKNSFVDSFLSAIDPTRTNDTTLVHNKQKCQPNDSVHAHCSNEVSWSPYSDCDDLTELFIPAACHLESKHGSLARSWSKLDSLDVQEMLQLLESTTDVLYGVATHSDLETNDACKDKEDVHVNKETGKDESSKEQDSPERESPPVPQRILRPRKQTKSTQCLKTSDKPIQRKKGGRK